LTKGISVLHKTVEDFEKWPRKSKMQTQNKKKARSSKRRRTTMDDDISDSDTNTGAAVGGTFERIKTLQKDNASEEEDEVLANSPRRKSGEGDHKTAAWKIQEKSS
jgi:hypothetical protein